MSDTLPAVCTRRTLASLSHPLHAALRAVLCWLLLWLALAGPARGLYTDDDDFPSGDFEVFAHGTFCCDQTPCKGGHSSFLFEGPGVTAAQCADRCLHDYNPDICRYIVVATVGSGTPYCMNAQFCNSTNRFGGENVTIYHRTLPERPPAPPPPPSKPPQSAFFVIDPASKTALITNVSQPVYSGAAGAGMHGKGIPTAAHLSWAKESFPWFEADDIDLEAAYYFRMYSYHNHINQSTSSHDAGHLPDQFHYVTEFYPHVPWAGKLNTIPCAAGHHIHEGRWLRDPQIMSDYLSFWFWGGGSVEAYTFWIATSAWANYEIAGNKTLLDELYPELASNYHNNMFAPNFNKEFGCYWHLSDREGEENSVGGDGCRPVSNSVMYGEASALQKIAALLGNTTAAAEWGRQAAFWQEVILTKLWSEELDFFVTLTVPKPNSTDVGESGRPEMAGDVVDPPAGPGSQCPSKGQPHWPVGQQVTVREIMGYSPWYFGVLPKDSSSKKYLPAFKQLTDPQGFAAKWGPRTAELRAPCYNFTQFRSYTTRHECNWNGPSWPFETAKLITGMGNLLVDYPSQDTVTSQGLMDLLRQYARQHTQGVAANGASPWIGEVMHPETGEWLARQLMYGSNNKLKDRGIWYNHSTFIDLILSALFGFRAGGPNSFSIFPQAAGLDWMAIDNLRYQGHDLSLIWDKGGKKYGKGKGLHALVAGKVVASSPTMGRLVVQLP